MGHAEHVPEAVNLEGLVERSDTILVGTVTDLTWATDRTLGEEQTSMPPTSCFQVAVERVLREDGELKPQGTVKVLSTGAVLSGVASLVAEQPLLTVGERYFLFLRSPKVTKWEKFGGWPCRYDGVDGIAGHLDEYAPADWAYWQVLLEGGVTLPARDAWQTGPKLPFREGPQLWDLPQGSIANRWPGGFFIVPNLFVDRFYGLSGNAIKLYFYLWRWADRNTAESFRSRVSVRGHRGRGSRRGRSRVRCSAQVRRIPVVNMRGGPGGASKDGMGGGPPMGGPGGGRGGMMEMMGTMGGGQNVDYEKPFQEGRNRERLQELLGLLSK
jgi:hypothetical protein